jgi:hypothetical protein
VNKAVSYSYPRGSRPCTAGRTLQSAWRCRLARRSAPRLQACFRRSVGGFHWQATDELIGVRSRSVIGPSMDDREIRSVFGAVRIEFGGGARSLADRRSYLGRSFRPTVTSSSLASVQGSVFVAGELQIRSALGAARPDRRVGEGAEVRICLAIRDRWISPAVTSALPTRVSAQTLAAGSGGRRRAAKSVRTRGLLQSRIEGRRPEKRIAFVTGPIARIAWRSKWLSQQAFLLATVWTEACDFRRTQDPLGTAYWDIGAAQHRLGALKEAEATYQHLIELYPTGNAYHYRRALALLSNRDAMAALEQMGREYNPAYKQAGLALAFEALGRRSEADHDLPERSRRGAARWPIRSATCMLPETMPNTGSSGSNAHTNSTTADCYRSNMIPC